MRKIESFLKERKELIDKKLKEFLLPLPPYGRRLYEAVEYSLMAGGKRLRPILCLCSCEAVCGDYEPAIVPACAIEFIHTYSLVHDDLPAMDNDTLRRGKPTTWFKFDEPTAILAGDALLNRAFEILAEWDFDSERKVEVMKEISFASGMRGMVLGQQCDIEAEKKEITEEELKFIHLHKTGKLITASVVAGGITGGAGEKEIEALREYGRRIGVAFQIIDDVLDVVGDEKKMGKEKGSDQKKGKKTFVLFHGVEGSVNIARKEVEKAIESLKVFPEERVWHLKEIAKFIVEREY